MPPRWKLQEKTLTDWKKSKCWEKHYKKLKNIQLNFAIHPNFPENLKHLSAKARSKQFLIWEI